MYVYIYIYINNLVLKFVLTLIKLAGILKQWKTLMSLKMYSWFFLNGLFLLIKKICCFIVERGFSLFLQEL